MITHHRVTSNLKNNSADNEQKMTNGKSDSMLFEEIQ